MSDSKSDAKDSVAELLHLHDEAFVNKAYEVILGRTPDSGGFSNYLAQVRNGVHRGHIIAELALSEEGRTAAPTSQTLRAIINRYREPRRFSVTSFCAKFGRSRLQVAEQQIRVLENKLYVIEQLCAVQTQVCSTLTEKVRQIAQRAVSQPVSEAIIADKRAITDTLRASLPVNVRRTFLNLQNALEQKRIP